MSASKPTSLNAYVTDRCTNRCVFCTGQGQRPGTPDLTVGVLASALDVFPSVTSVCVAGLGEPLLAETAPELVELCLGRSLFTSLITNGHLVRKVPLPYTLLGYVNVSMNACNREEYEARCGVDAFDKAQDAVRVLVENEARAGVSFVVSRKTLHRVPAWLRWSAAMRAGFVSLMNLLPRGPDDESWEHEVLRPEDLGELPQWRALAASMGVHVNAWPTAVPCDAETRELGGPSPCRSPFETVGVDGAGNTTGCQRIARPRASYGNVLRDGSACFARRHFSALRGRLTAGQPSALCRKCFGTWV